MTYQLDTDSAWGFIVSVFRLIQGSMSLDPEAIQALMADPHPARLTWAIFAVVILSMSLGQSVILFVNQVSPRRFGVSLVVAALIQGSSIVLWLLASYFLAGFYYGDGRVAFVVAARIFVLGHAPFALAFLTVIPYIGIFWPHLLRVWCLVCIGVGLQGLGLHVKASLILTGFGYLLVLLFHQLMRPVLSRMNSWAWLHVGGVEQRYGTAKDRLAATQGPTGTGGS